MAAAISWTSSGAIAEDDEALCLAVGEAHAVGAEVHSLIAAREHRSREDPRTRPFARLEDEGLRGRVRRDEPQRADGAKDRVQMLVRNSGSAQELGIAQLCAAGVMKAVQHRDARGRVGGHVGIVAGRVLDGWPALLPCRQLFPCSGERKAQLGDAVGCRFGGASIRVIMSR